MGEQGWDAGERMGMVGTGCVGHTEQEARGPDVARAALRMQGPEHLLCVGWQDPFGDPEELPKENGGEWGGLPTYYRAGYKQNK